MDQVVTQDPKELQVRTEIWDPQDLLDLQDQQDPSEILDPKDMLALKDYQVHLVLKELKDSKDLRDPKALKEPPEQLDLQERLDLKDLKDLMDLKDNMDPRDHRDHRDPMVLLVTRETKVAKDLQEFILTVSDFFKQVVATSEPPISIHLSLNSLLTQMTFLIVLL